MKKIYLVILLIFPIALVAQDKDSTSVSGKVIDSLLTKTKEIKERVYPVKDSIPTSVIEKKNIEKVVVEKVIVAEPTEKATKPTEKIANATSTVAAPKCVTGNCIGGIGTMKYQSGTYEGRWKNGLRHGLGNFTWNNGDSYKGSWFQDRRHGEGEYKWSDDTKYVGHYDNGVRSGYGIYYYTNGNIYEGTWQNNLKHGIANFYFKNSVNIGGKYVNNEYVNGTGVNQESYKYKP